MTAGVSAAVNAVESDGPEIVSTDRHTHTHAHTQHTQKAALWLTRSPTTDTAEMATPGH